MDKKTMMENLARAAHEKADSRAYGSTPKKARSYRKARSA